MPRYRCTYKTTIHLTVDVSADDEDQASETSWDAAEEYLRTVYGTSGGAVDVSAQATLDGIGADEIKEIR